MIEANLPALQVVIPLLAAPVSAIIGHARTGWLIAVAASWLALAIAWRLFRRVLDGEVWSYALGGWAAPWGIEYRVDILNAFVLLIVAGIGAVAVLFARQSVDDEIPREKHHLFYAAYLLCLAGLLGITITGDAFNVFVFLEISSLSSYALISMGRSRRALTAAFTYLVMGTIGATFFLIGIGLLYMMTGTLNMVDLSQRLQPLGDSRVVLTAFAFITVGMALKLALFPLHLWLPNAYSFAPSFVTVFLAATATKVSIYVLLRFVFTVFGIGFSFAEFPLAWALFVPAVLAMFAGSIVAVFQRDLKRMLAYSSVAQIGYIVLGISMATVGGVSAGLLHVFNHALIKAALFCALGCIVFRIGNANIEAIGGIARRMPWTMAAFVIGGLSLIGVPLTGGFVSKWFLVTAALDLDLWWLAALILISTLLALAYVWRVIEAAYLAPESSAVANASEAPMGLLIPTWIFVLANVLFGIWTRLPIDGAERAALQLLRIVS